MTSAVASVVSFATSWSMNSLVTGTSFVASRATSVTGACEEMTASEAAGSM